MSVYKAMLHMINDKMLDNRKITEEEYQKLQLQINRSSDKTIADRPSVCYNGKTE